MNNVVSLDQHREPWKPHIADMQFIQFQSLATGVTAHLQVLPDDAFAAEYRALNTMLSASPTGETMLDALAELYAAERDRRRVESDRRNFTPISEPSPF